MENIIEISHLNKSFQEIQAVVDLSFRVKEGELFAFLGVNGAWEVHHHIHPMRTAGQGQRPGEDLRTGAGGKYRGHHRELGVVFQSSVLDGVLTVRTTCRVGLPCTESQAGPSGSAWMSLGSCWVSRSFWGEP